MFADAEGFLFPLYPAQYSMSGGDVSVFAQNDIIHLTRNGIGELIADSDKELPMNWLYRRGFVDPSGVFGTGIFGDVASTTWWIDFSNFFEGVGTLGGGNVTLIAGHDVSNVDAVADTNARMPGKDSNGNPIAPNANSLLELGGGDVTVRAGNDINGGVYYVERGNGSLIAGNSIITNSTRAAQLQNATVTDSSTWLPTTLFLGKGNFEVFADRDVTLGPVANVFMLPTGINNNYTERSYFSTYGATDSVEAQSLTGNMTIKDSSDIGNGSLIDWFQNVFLYYLNPNSWAHISEPWLRLGESRVSSFSTFTALMPPVLKVTAFLGDVDVIGRLTLAPAPTGSIDLLVAGSINGFQVNGLDTGNQNLVWGSSLINLSDADPGSVPGITDPLSSQATLTPTTLTPAVNALFNETGSTTGSAAVIQTKQALHAPGLLHASDTEPIHLYALGGSISGTTVFSAKFARIIAGQDITDVGLYVQNNSSSNISVISA